MSTVRESRADLATSTHVLDAGFSLDARPDAVSWDYLTAFTVGPRALGDPSAGLVRRVWRVQAEGSFVFLSGADESNTAWEGETSLFATAGAQIREVDAAFDQNARVVVCAERATGPGGAPEVWLYHYDTLTAQYEFRNLGAGRNPRVLLDDPFETTQSDVLLFYVSDAAGAVVYRQQRDRYGVERPTPLTGVADYFLEEVARDGSGRVQVIGSVRDPATGWYTLRSLESSLYPVYTAGRLDPFSASAALAGIGVRDVVLRPALGPEGVDVPHTLRSVAVYDPTLKVYPVQDQSHTASHSLESLLVRPLVFRIDQRDATDGGHTASHRLQVLQVRSLILTHRQPDDGSSHTASHALNEIRVHALVEVFRQPAGSSHHTVSHSLGGIQVRPLIQTHRQPADPQTHTASHALTGVDVVYLVREIHHTGQPSLEENLYEPRHSLRSVSVVRV